MSDELRQFTDYITKQFDKLEEKIDRLAENFVSKAEMEHYRNDVNRAHEKIRELFIKREDDNKAIDKRMHALEIVDAGNAGHMTWFQKIASAAIGILALAAAAFFGLK